MAPAGSDELARLDLSEMSARRLHERLADTGRESALLGKRVSLGAHTIEIGTKLEDAGYQANSHVVGLGFAVALDGKRLAQLDSGSVGVGATPGEAASVSIDEWISLVGIAIVDAVHPKATEATSPKKPMRFGDYSVRPGATGVRGTVELKWSDAEHGALLGMLKPAVDQSPAKQPGLRAIELKIVVSTTGGVEGEARLDGEASPLLLQRARTYPWPKSEQAYMFKQFYLLQPLDPPR